MNVTQTTKDIIYKLVYTREYNVRTLDGREEAVISIDLGTRVHIEKMYINEHQPHLVEVYVPSLELYIESISMFDLKRMIHSSPPPRPSSPKECGHYYDCGCNKTLCDVCMENKFYKCLFGECKDQNCAIYYINKTKDSYCFCNQRMCDYCY